MSFPACAAVSKAIAQTSNVRIAARKLNQLTLIVTDLRRSLDFYQGLFGMPIQARRESLALLRIGRGPQYLALKEGGAPSFSYYGIGVEGFDPAQMQKILADHGFTRTAGNPGPMQFQLQNRAGTAELFLADPDGILVQIQDTKYCGGAGAQGNVCKTIESLPRKGLLTLRDLSHVTIFCSNAPRSQTLYQNLYRGCSRTRCRTSSRLII